MATTSGITDTDGKTNLRGERRYGLRLHLPVDPRGRQATETDISGETSSTYTPSSSDVGKTIKVKVSFTDDLDNAEGPLTSDQTAAVTAASSCAEVWCATLTVQSISGGHRGCANSVSGKECSNTSHLTEDEFTHVGTDYTVTSVQVRSGGELRLFINPNLTTATRSLVLLVGAERFALAHADTKGVNFRYWRSSGLSWSSGATVELKLVEASTVATLSGLDIRDGNANAVALTPGFSSGTTSYTALVANTVGRITLTETTSDENASVAYLDVDDNPLTDADTGTTGHQVDLVEGANTIKVKVTAEDGVATRTYTVTVTVTRAAAGNTAATGKPSITGTAEVGQTLTASTSGISDANGKTKAENGDAGYAYTYQWVRVDGTNETDIAGATSDTYRLVQADAGKTFRVKVSFKDNAGNSEGPLTSNEYPVSGAYGDLRLADGPTVDSGRLEAFYRGQWGTVCDDRFADETFKIYGPDNTSQSDDRIVPNVAPQLACQLMGYSTGEVVSRGYLGMNVVLAEPEDGGPKTWLDDVRCAEGSDAGRAAPVLPRGRGAGELHPRGGRAPALLSSERRPGRVHRAIPGGA